MIAATLCLPKATFTIDLSFDNNLINLTLTATIVMILRRQLQFQVQRRALLMLDPPLYHGQNFCNIFFDHLLLFLVYDALKLIDFRDEHS